LVPLSAKDNDNATRAALMSLARNTGNQGFFGAAGPARSEQTLAVRTNPVYFKAHSLAALRGVNDAFVGVFETYAAK